MKIKFKTFCFPGYLLINLILNQKKPARSGIKNASKFNKFLFC